MSPSAEPVQNTADLDAQVEEMLRDSNPAGTSSSAEDPAPAVDAAISEAVDDAAALQRRRAEDLATEPSPEEPASESTTADAAGIDALDAALAENAEKLGAAPEGELSDDFSGDLEGVFEGVNFDLDEPTPPAPAEPESAATPAAAAPAAAPVPTAAPAKEPAPPEPARTASPPAEPAPLPPAREPRGVPVLTVALAAVSRRLERLSPTARQTLSWAAYLTALNAAAVWTVVLLRSPGTGVPAPAAAGETAAAADHSAGKSASSHGSGATKPAAKSSASKPAAKSGGKAAPKSGGH